MDGTVYLTLARQAISSVFMQTEIDREQWCRQYPELLNQGATFVTLTQESKLRGCIGSLIAHRPLIDDLIANARSAAFRDPRFQPLRVEELAFTRVEVSLLTPPQQIKYSSIQELKDLIKPQVDGIILRDGNHQATFLPQVWEELNQFEEFFIHLGHKAGLGSNPFLNHPEIYTYQVAKFKES